MRSVRAVGDSMGLERGWAVLVERMEVINGDLWEIARLMYLFLLIRFTQQNVTICEQHSVRKRPGVF